MAVYDILPDTNLRDVDIRDTLNSNGGSTTCSNWGTFFSEDAKINMWSKYKPVVSTSAFLNTDKRWQGDDGKCGLTIPTYTSPSTLRSAIQSGAALWSYTPPQGGTSEPRRIGDFRGYCPDAYNPLGLVATNGIQSGGYVTFAIDVAISGSSATNLLLTDICVNGYGGTPISEYYLGIYAWKSGSYVFRTASTKIGEASSLEVEIPISSTGEWNYAPFLASSIQGDSEQSGTFLGVNKQPQIMTVVTSGSLKCVDPYGSWNAAYTSVLEVSAYITNATSSSVTFTNVKVWLVRSTGTDPESASTVAGTTVTYSSSVTVAANSSEIVYLSDIAHTKASGYNYWIAASSDQSTEVRYNELDQMSDEE